MAGERPKGGKAAAFRKVQCYHCRRTFDVGARAMTITCPKCFKRVQVQDVIVKEAQGLTRLQTCGRIVIEKKGRVVADLIEAHQGIEVKGLLQGAAVSGGPVVLRAKASWKGNCRAPVLHIEQGAKIHGGFFEIADDVSAQRLGLSPLPGAGSLTPDSDPNDERVKANGG